MSERGALALVVIGLGGNVGTEAEIVERFRRARGALERLGPLRSAPLYRTAPIGPDQPPFLNSAVAIQLSDLAPGALIAIVLGIERQLGRDRERETRWGPRLIDLDVLVWGARTIRSSELEVPHPRLAHRRFALVPVAALLGVDAQLPQLGAISSLLPGVAAQPLEQIAETW